MKKLFIVASLLFINQQSLQAKDVKTIVLNSPLLRVADNAGIFHAPIVDILQTRMDIVDLIQGLKKWVGVIMQVKIANATSNDSLTIYCRRPEIICGATYITIAPDHELVATLTTQEQKHEVTTFVKSIMKESLYDRQINSTNAGVFSGSYAINPFNQELLPIYISDYAIECFDIRHSNARLGVPAHNSKDLDFARSHNLPIKIVVDVQRQLQGKHDEYGPVVAAPLFDKKGNLQEAYLGEYSACIITNSDVLNDEPLKDAAKYVVDYLTRNNCGYPHTEILQYSHNNQSYSIKDLAKIETAVYKNNTSSPQINTLKKELKMVLNYAQADFLEIVEKFIININNTKTLMIALIEESCSIRENSNCYLLQWCQLKGNENEKEIFRRDITSMKELTIFCKDLVNFLGDFVHSCPKALENIRKQNS